MFHHGENSASCRVVSLRRFRFRFALRQITHHPSLCYATLTTLHLTNPLLPSIIYSLQLIKHRPVIMSDGTKKRSYSTMAGDKESPKQPGADIHQANDNNGPKPALMEPALSPANNESMVNDQIAITTTTAGESYDEEGQKVDQVSGGDDDKEKIDQGNDAGSAADHDETVAVSENKEELGDGTDDGFDAGEGVASAAAAEGHEEDEDDEDEGEDIGDQGEGDEEMEDDEHDEEDEEEEEEDDPDHVSTYLTAFPAPDHAAAATGRPS
jgi:hypothetical protein